MMTGKKVSRGIVIIAFSILLIFMTGCNNSKVETGPEIVVPEKTTTVTLDKAESTKTCRAEQYDMDMKLDVKNKLLSGQVAMRLTNETRDTLDELCIRTDATDGMAITNLRIIETSEHPEIKSKSKDSAVYLDISSTQLKPGETITLQFDFITEIPKTNNRFGYAINGDDEIYQLTFCYPRIAMYENGAWDESPYITDGAENNYVTVSDYNVDFEAPENLMIIASGNEKTEGNLTKITGKNMRQLAIFAGTNIKKDSQTVNDVKINNYYFDHEGNKKYNDMALEAAKDSVNLFSTLIGEYPYEELDIVHGFYSSAMEYSGVILMGTPDVEDRTALDEYAAFTNLSSGIAHETAHQWFYGVVGNDPYNEPWMDETFAEYCEDMLYQQSKLPGIAAAIKHDQKFGGSDTWGTMSDKEFNRWTDDMIEQMTGNSYIINKPYNEYDAENQKYSQYVYTGGSYFLYQLRKTMGDGVFFPMLQEYYKAYYFNECNTEEFVDIILEFDDSEEVRNIINKYIQ